MVKQREESAKTYDDNGRPELADKERAEIEIVREFMPKPLSEEEMTSVIAELVEEMGATGLKDMGKIMGRLKSSYAGRPAYQAACYTSPLMSMPHTLIFMRHAKSSWKHAGLVDHERPLNGRGERSAKLMRARSLCAISPNFTTLARMMFSRFYPSRTPRKALLCCLATIRVGPAYMKFIRDGRRPFPLRAVACWD